MKKQEVRVALADFLALERRVCEDSYYQFFKIAWKRIPEVGNEPLVDNFHIRYLCEVLQKRIERVALLQPKDKDLIVNIPPRTLKTNIVSAFLNAWAWTKWPHLRFICASYAQPISEDINKRVLKIINSDWYRLLWGHVFNLTLSNSGQIDNDRGGERFATSITGSCTGKGCDVFILDDPLNPVDAESAAMRKQSIDFYTGVARSRLNNQNVGLRMLVMQRLHEEDMSGYLLEQEEGSWLRICLPATDDYPIYPRALAAFYRNGLLFPERLPREFLDVERNKSTYPGQYGQSPRPPEGNLFTQDMFEIVEELPDTFDYMFATSDTAYKDKQNNDFTVCAVFGAKGQDLYLYDVARRKIKASDCEQFFRSFLSKYRHLYGFRSVYIEPKGHGIFLNQKFAAEHILVPSEKKLQEFYADRRLDKVQRANNILGHLSNWKVKVNAQIAGLGDLLDECYNFPKGKHDDFVDCLIDGVKLFKQNTLTAKSSRAVSNDLAREFRAKEY